MSKAGATPTRRLAIVAGMSLAVAPPALAHRSQSVLTTVTWNSKTSTLDVMHRVHSGDAEAGLAKTTGAAAVDITEVKNQAQLVLYIESHFVLLDGGKAMKLEAVGAEIEGEAVLVYQECMLAKPPVELSIEDRILRDVFDGQTNLVNVRLAQRTRTLIFSGQDGAKKAEGLL